MSIEDIPDIEILAPRSYCDFRDFKIVLKKPLYTKEEIEEMKIEVDDTLMRLREECRAMVKIGKIVTIFDPDDMRNISDELFFVIGFQPDIDDNELVVALMDNEYKTFLINIDNVVVREFKTIDDMFKPNIRTVIVNDTSDYNPYTLKKIGG